MSTSTPHDAENIPDAQLVDPAQFGELFRRARRQKSVKLTDASRDLRLRLEYLEAIEDGRLADLPGTPYTQGFIRSYAVYLGLDPVECLAMLKASSSARTAQPQDRMTLPLPSVADRLPNPRILVIAAGLCLALVLLGYWFFKPQSPSVPSSPESSSQSSTNRYNKGSETTSTTKPHEHASKAHPTELSKESGTPPSQESEHTTATLFAPTAASDTSTALDKSHVKGHDQLQIRAKSTSWIRLYDKDGKTHTDRTLKLGDVLDVPAGLYLSSGNAGGIEILLDGKLIKTTGKHGIVQRDLLMDPETIATQLSTENKRDPISAAKAKEPNSGTAKVARSPSSATGAKKSPEKLKAEAPSTPPEANTSATPSPEASSPSSAPASSEAPSSEASPSATPTEAPVSETTLP